MVERIRRYWADTIRHTEKISLGQTFTDILNLCCDLDLEHSNPIFPQDTLAHDAVLWIKFGCKLTTSLEDTTEIVIFLLYKPSLRPWHWTQWASFSAWHSGLWCCLTTPGLVTKWSVVQKISGQTFTNILNLRCAAVITFFHRILQLMMLYY